MDKRTDLSKNQRKKEHKATPTKGQKNKFQMLFERGTFFTTMLL